MAKCIGIEAGVDTFGVDVFLDVDPKVLRLSRRR